MEAVTFNLSGKTACFRKPDVNDFSYFTYHHIHKIALMGILGSILGLKGYAQQEKEDVFPEFYEKLDSLFLSVLPPRNQRGFFTKKIQVFNNSVGYASKEQGGNLIVREQWLEDPSWQIYIGKTEAIDEVLWLKLKTALLTSTAEYIPYLGKNDHPATLLNPRALQLILENNTSISQIDSLYKIEDFKVSSKQMLSTREKKVVGNIDGYLFQDYMPNQLAKENNGYQFKKYGYTDHILDCVAGDVWIDEASNLKIVSL